MDQDSQGESLFPTQLNQYQQFCQVHISLFFICFISFLCFVHLSCTFPKTKSVDKWEKKKNKKLVFPLDLKKNSVVDELVSQGNPFKMPADSDIFVLRDKERQRKKLVRFFLNFQYWNNEVISKNTFAFSYICNQFIVNFFIKIQWDKLVPLLVKKGKFHKPPTMLFQYILKGTRKTEKTKSPWEDHIRIQS